MFGFWGKANPIFLKTEHNNRLLMQLTNGCLVIEVFSYRGVRLSKPGFSFFDNRTFCFRDTTVHIYFEILLGSLFTIIVDWTTLWFKLTCLKRVISKNWTIVLSRFWLNFTSSIAQQSNTKICRDSAST